MRLLTFNISSGVGYDPDMQLYTMIKALTDQVYDVIALQQVNQLTDQEEIPVEKLDSYIPCQDRVPIKKGNFAYRLVEMLKNTGQYWYWSWLPVHVGYGHFDEGLAILTPHPIRKTHVFYLSNRTDYNSFKTRMALGIQTVFSGEPEWFYDVQFGWWNDGEEPFKEQWDRFIDKTKGIDDPMYVLGSFTASDTVPGEAYDYIFETSSFLDVYKKAEFRDDGITFVATGEGGSDPHERESMRADLILCNRDEKVLDCRVLFKGDHYEKISHHFGLSAEFGETTENSSPIKGDQLPEFTSKKTMSLPLTIVRKSGPLIIRTRRDRIVGENPRAYLRELYRRAQLAMDILEEIEFLEEE